MNLATWYRRLAVLVALALSLAAAAPSYAVDPKAEKEIAEVAAGIQGTVATFYVEALLAGTESADLLAAPGAGLHYQIIWLDWVPTTTTNGTFQILAEPSGSALFTGRTGITSANAANNFKPNVLINLNSNKAFRVKNIEATNNVEMRLSARYIVVND